MHETRGRLRRDIWAVTDPAIQQASECRRVMFIYSDVSFLHARQHGTCRAAPRPRTCTGQDSRRFVEQADDKAARTAVIMDCRLVVLRDSSSSVSAQSKVSKRKEIVLARTPRRPRSQSNPSAGYHSTLMMWLKTSNHLYRVVVPVANTANHTDQAHTTKKDAIIGF